MRKNHLFLSLLSNQTETKGTSVHVRCYSPPKELLWRGAGHDGSVPTAPCCPLSWAGQNPPQSLSPSPSQNLIPWKQGFLPQGYLGRRGAQSVGWCWGWAESSPRPCPLVVQLFKAGWRVQRLGCLPLAAPSCQMAAQSPLLIYCCVPRKMNAA